MKLQEAKETTVFEIEDGVIKEVNLYEKMQRSVDETTSPRGVEPVCFIREIESIIDAEDFNKSLKLYDFYPNDNTYRRTFYEVCKWYFGKVKTIETNLTEEEAEELIFSFLKVDFDADWDNSCNIFYSFEDAEQNMAENMGVDIEVYRSIAKKELIVREAKFIRKLQERRAQEKIFNDMANMYASQVLRVPFESKHETEVRVSKQFGRIDKNVFWRVINKVRAEQNKR